MPTTRPTYCRVCEAACGLLAEVEGDRVLALHPDKDHPLSKGYACVKGTRFAAIQHHPHRVERPLWRADRAQALAPVSWDAALASIGERLRALRDEHGPESIGIFSGTAAGHSMSHVLGLPGLQRALGTTRHYSSLTLDNAPQYVVLEACFGNAMATCVADYAGADLILLLGTDPLSSQASQSQSNPDAVRELRERAAAGALWVVDPRRSLTASKASGHLAPLPGGDVFLLAHWVREVLLRRPPQDDLLDSEDVRRLAEVVAPFDAALAARRSGVGEADLALCTEALLRAERPLVWSGLGILLGPHGTLGFWLTVALQAVLGGLDRPGGWLHHGGVVDIPWLWRFTGVRAHDPAVRSVPGGHPAVLGTLPAATLVDAALSSGPDRLRALIVVAGNPAISLPDGDRVREALAGLDLLVCVDLFVSDTGTLAHAVLPAQTWLERDETAVHLSAWKRRPHLQIAPPVVAPRGEARDDFEILCDLARAAGRPMFGSRLSDWAVRAGFGPRSASRLAFALGGRGRWRDAVADARGLVGGEDRGRLRARLPGGRVRLAVPAWCDALAALAKDAPAPDGGLVLVSSVRPIDEMNSWVRAGKSAEEPVAEVHPDDLAAAGLVSGALVEIRNAEHPDRALRVVVRANASVRRGVLVLPHGWGRVPGAFGSQGTLGVNVNRLVPSSAVEPFVGQPISNGLRVTLQDTLSRVEGVG